MTHHINYTLRHSRRARAMRLTVYPDGAVTVTAPYRAPLSFVELFVSKHAAWIARKIQFVNEHVKKYTPHGNAKDFVLYREQARQVAEARVRHFNEQYGFSVGRITIRNQKTRWGSCSKTGNLNFNYKIACMPAHLVDYIIVHELCHIGQFNHSRAFWTLVARALPEYAEYRKELRS